MVFFVVRLIIFKLQETNALPFLPSPILSVITLFWCRMFYLWSCQIIVHIWYLPYFNQHSLGLNYSFVEGIGDRLYTIGYGQYKYFEAYDLCRWWGVYHGQLLNWRSTKEMKIIQRHFSSRLPIWVFDKNLGDCHALDNVRCKFSLIPF